MEEIKIKGRLAFKDNKAHIVYEKVAVWNEVDGCEYFKDLLIEKQLLEKEVLELEKQIYEKRQRLLQNRAQQIDLEKNGFCPIDHEEVRLVGAMTQTTITHRKNCRNK